MYKVFRRKPGRDGYKPLSHTRLAIIASFMATLLCFPWGYLMADSEYGTVFGLPMVYFLNVLFLPLLVLLVLFWFMRKADQTDRFEQ